MLMMREIRESLGLSGSEVARRVGVPQSTYSTWENGTVKISLERACDVADVLRCTLDELAGRSRAKPAGIAAVEQAWESMNRDGRAALEMTAAGLASLPGNRKSAFEDASADRRAL